MTSARPLPPRLPVGNQQTGRCEWTVKLYSAACRLPGGRYAIMSRHALLPVPCAPSTLPPRLCARVHAQLLCNCGSCGGHWCREVCFDFKSLPPPRTWRGGASWPLPPSTCPGHRSRPPLDWWRGGRRKGLRILCVHVWGTPCVRAYTEVPEESQPSDLRGLGIRGRRPCSPLSLPSPLP